MKEIKSVTHYTSNEQSLEEVEIEYARTFIQFLFRKPASIIIWVRRGNNWYLKGDSSPVGVDDLLEINRAKDVIRLDMYKGITKWHC